MYQVSPILRAITGIPLTVRVFLILIFSAFFAPVSLVAAADWASAVRYPLAANGLALGNANVAVVRGAASLSANPAGLSVISTAEAQATHLTPMQDVSLDAISIVFPASWGGWGISAQQLAATGMVKTDTLGNVIGIFDYYEDAVTLAGGTRYRSSELGLSLRGLWQSMDDAQKGGFELLAGVQQQVAPGWSAGVVASYLWQPRPDRDPDSPNDNGHIQAGLTYAGNAISVHAAVEKRRSAIGLAYRPLAGLELRAASEHAAGATTYRLGLGLAGQFAAIDYAYLAGGQSELPEQLALGHVVSVRFSF